VIDAVSRFYREDNANVHRGTHTLSQRVTQAYNAARVKVQRFINAPHSRECVFVRGTTEAINLVAQSFGRTRLGEGDEILLTELEHHSNIVPWQLLREQTGARIRVAPIDDDGKVIFEEFTRRLTPRTRLVAIAHVSNALGTINPVKRMIEAAHAEGIPVMVDGAQAAPHMRIDVQDLDCDFYAFSGHKLYGPTGIGVLYGKGALLDAMRPYQGGGDMIHRVSFEASETVSRELGVSVATLERWRAQALAEPHQQRRWTAAARLGAVIGTATPRLGRSTVDVAAGAVAHRR